MFSGALACLPVNAYLIRKVALLEGEHEDLQRLSKTNNEELASLQSENECSQSIIEQLQKENQALSKQLTNLQVDHKSLTESVEFLEKQLHEASAALSSTEEREVELNRSKGHASLSTQDMEDKVNSQAASDQWQTSC